MPKHLLHGHIRKKNKGRFRNRYLQDMEQDMRRMRIKDWKQWEQERDNRRKIVMEVKE